MLVAGTHSGLLLYFTTGSLIAAWQLGKLIIRKIQLPWYRLLVCARGHPTVDHATILRIRPLRCFSICLFATSLPDHLTTVGCHFVFVVLFFRFAAVGVVSVSVLLAVCRNLNCRLLAQR